LTASFDQVHKHRLVVQHGNTGTANYVLLTSPSTETFDFSIQAIDNAYHYSKNAVCNGGMGCTTLLDPVTKQVCRNENVTLTAGAGSIWFSFGQGFLGIGNSIEYSVAASDTVFAVQPAAGGCSIVSVYILKLTEKTLVVEDVLRHVCNGETIELTASDNFIYNWSTPKRGFLSSEQSISFTVTDADTIKLKLSDGFASCNKLIRTTLRISQPEVNIESDGIQILKGKSVQLFAQGDAVSYSWVPPASLDNPQSQNPIATPTVTTEYTVTATDSIGCTATDKILIIVEQTAFIPTLFTPNDDGKNDELRVYGLANVKEFKLSIFNREGSLVYASSDPNEVTMNGWNGATRGQRQPGGVYYWKVNGETAQGKKILLNGKSSGSIVLIR
jgi:gliding motility-associated-like protein